MLEKAVLDYLRPIKFEPDANMVSIEESIMGRGVDETSRVFRVSRKE